MENLRGRLTTHLSFAIGGSGILYLAINSFEKSGQNELTIGLICAFSSAIISSFFYLALYKYNSMNRYAGYCKLINLEIEFNPINSNTTDLKHTDFPKNIITWELCVAKFANSKDRAEFDIYYWTNILKFKAPGLEISEIEETFHDYKLLNPRKDYHSVRKGVKTFFKGINRNSHSESWKYPLYSSYIYYVLIVFFIVLSSISLGKYINSSTISFAPGWTFPPVEVFLITFLLLVTSKVLYKSFSDLHKLMDGSRTVAAYCWKLFPYRIRVLNKFNIEPTYYRTTKKDANEIKVSKSKKAKGKEDK
jgi:hypothetical protein